MEDENRYFMEEAIRLSMLQDKGGPFGAVIARDGIIIGSGRNEVLANQDPTCHAEMMAIRHACKSIGDFKLTGCVLYTSCEPCPMCWAAAGWANIKTIFYGCTRYDAASIGFDDEFLYDELNQPLDNREITMFLICRDEAKKAFESWNTNPNKSMY